jgi:SAM-dependent methyltransferase
VNHAYDSAEAIRRWNMHARQLLQLANSDPEEGDPHRIVLLNPALFTLLPDVQDKRVLDAGCGEGYLCRKLARLGAHVTGVDYSEEMLAMARERTDPALGIRYLHGNCEHMDFLDPDSFDLVVSNMMLMDLADYEAALFSMHRALVDDGILLLSISHPCFTTPDSGWVRDDKGNRLYWKVDRYFIEGAYEQRVPPDAEEGLILFHRTLSTYLRTLLRMSFLLLDVIEPMPAEDMMDRYPHFRDDVRMSHFIILKLQKQQRATPDGAA